MVPAPTLTSVAMQHPPSDLSNRPQCASQTVPAAERLFLAEHAKPIRDCHCVPLPIPGVRGIHIASHHLQANQVPFFNPPELIYSKPTLNIIFVNICYNRSGASIPMAHRPFFSVVATASATAALYGAYSSVLSAIFSWA